MRACKTCDFAGRSGHGNIICCLNPPVLLGSNSKFDPRTNTHHNTPVFGCPEVGPDNFCSHWREKDEQK